MSKHPLVKDLSVGTDYLKTVVHIGAAMIDESKHNNPLYGGSLIAEYSHKSGAIHVSVHGGERFWEWLKQHEDLLKTECTGGWKLKKNIVEAVLEKLSAAYVNWTKRGCPGRDRS